MNKRSDFAKLADDYTKEFIYRAVTLNSVNTCELHKQFKELYDYCLWLEKEVERHESTGHSE